MLIPDYNDVLTDDLNRFAFTTGVAKVADKLNDDALRQFKLESDGTAKTNKQFEMSSELRKMLDEKPVTQALEKILADRDEIRMPEE